MSESCLLRPQFRIGNRHFHQRSMDHRKFHGLTQHQREWETCSGSRGRRKEEGPGNKSHLHP